MLRYDPTLLRQPLPEDAGPYVLMFRVALWRHDRFEPLADIFEHLHEAQQLAGKMHLCNPDVRYAVQWFVRALD